MGNEEKKTTQEEATMQRIQGMTFPVLAREQARITRATFAPATHNPKETVPKLMPTLFSPRKAVKGLTQRVASIYSRIGETSAPVFRVIRAFGDPSAMESCARRE